LWAEASDVEHIRQVRDGHDIRPIDEIWIVTTEGSKTSDSLARIWRWKLALIEASKRAPILRAWRTQGVEELSSYDECAKMRDLIYRVVLLAHKQAGKDGHVLLSLAGGRKAMSADMQSAGSIFGCAALLHVIARSEPLPNELENSDISLMTGPLRNCYANYLMPMVVSGYAPPNPVLLVDPQIGANDFAVNMPEDIGTTLFNGSTDLDEVLKARINNASSLLSNYSQRIGGSRHSNFRALYVQRPDQVHRLVESRIGLDPAKKTEELEWLQRLPKTDLHCHLGGIADAREMIEIALCVKDDVHQYRNASVCFRNWLETVEKLISAKNIHGLRDLVPDPKGLRSRFKPKVPEPYAVAGFLQAFAANFGLLDEYIYGQYLDDGKFRNIGFAAYAKLGDLQGSGLLQCEKTIRAACGVLVRKATLHNVRYLELRCSPIKYTHGGLIAKQVVDFIMEQLPADGNCAFRLIFTGTRSSKDEEIKQHVELAKQLLKEKTSFADAFVGFDLAGDEASHPASKFRELYLPLMEKCIRLTIHAGESLPVQSVWEAVYHLSADRIGHGLELEDDSQLMSRFLDRRIALEMCPSSNAQIRCFDDNYNSSNSGKKYPLKHYLDEGLKVTVNTDNPGISRTDFTQELHMAARLTPGGLSRWEILRLIRNGLNSAFDRVERRLQRLEEVEKKAIEEALKF
jgi:adenosine deaminase